MAVKSGDEAAMVVGAILLVNWRRRHDFAVVCASPLRQEPLRMGEAAGIAAELDLVEQLLAANAPLRPTAPQTIDEIVG
jgi:hypothetical protein